MLNPKHQTLSRLIVSNVMSAFFLVTGLWNLMMRSLSLPLLILDVASILIFAILLGYTVRRIIRVQKN